MLEPLNVRQYGQYQFALSYASLPDFILRINFEPIAREYGMAGVYTLLHWQARPKPLRRWGAFCSHGDGSTHYHVFEQWRSQGCYQRGIQLDERVSKFVPTAVVWFPGCECRTVDGIGEIAPRGEWNDAVA